MIIKNYNTEPYNVFETSKPATENVFIPLFSTGRANTNISESYLIDEGYITNDMVYAVAKRIAQVTASLPVILENNGQYIDDENDELKRFIFENWHDNDSLEQALFKEVLYLILTGDSYHYAPYEYIGASLPSKNYILPPQNVRAWRETMSILSDIDRYEFNDGISIRKISPTEIMHCQYFNPTIEGIRNNEGLSPLQSGFDLLKATNNRNLAESSLYENRGASGIISSKNEYPITAEDREQLQRDFNNRVGGAKNANKIITVQGSVDYKQLGMSASDMELLGMRAEHLRAVCSLFGVQSVIFGDVGASTYNNMQEAMKDFYNQTCIPIMEQILAQKNKQLIKRYNYISGQKYKLTIDKNDIDALKPDAEKQLDSTVKLYQTGLISIDEARQILGYNDELAVTKTMTNLMRLSPLVSNKLLESLTPEELANLIKS